MTVTQPPMRLVEEPKGVGWTHHQVGFVTLHLFAMTRLWDRAGLVGDLAAALVAKDTDAVRARLAGLDGHFAVIAIGPETALAAVDPIRSKPLLWTEREGSVQVSASGEAMQAALTAGDLDPDVTKMMALSGFTIGASTLYRGVQALTPGTLVWCDGSRASVQRYTLWDAWNPRNDKPDWESLQDELSTLNRSLIDGLIADADGRPILAPLSAGCDSRLIVSGLKQAGYDRVHCIAYGPPGNREAEASKQIAERLGYPWRFIPYTQVRLRQTFRDPDHAAFVRSSDSLTGIFFSQEYAMLRTLRDADALPEDAILVNGQSGDFIAGNHIPKNMQNDAGPVDSRMGRITEALMAKHFRQWSSLRTPDRMARIASALAGEIEAIGGLPEDPAHDYGIYEFCELQDRQAKYVVNGQRVYEHFGLEWRLPLWERRYMEFWARAPLAAKAGQKLYRDVLYRDDWAGVWRSIPINASKITPAWIRPLRFALKVLHAPLGRARWHAFETRYLKYWMAPLCNYALHPYLKVAMDARGHQDALAWHIEQYLNAHGAAWDGTPLA